MASNRYVKYEDSIYIIVGIFMNEQLTSFKYNLVPVDKFNAYTYTSLKLGKVGGFAIGMDEVEEITDKKTKEILELLYG
jgi:hypothetical protein